MPVKNAPAETDPRIAERDTLVTEYLAQTSTGFRASKMRAIRAIETELFIDGVTFDPYVAPVKGKVTVADLTDADLAVFYADAIAKRLNPESGPGARAGATGRIRAAESEMTSRGQTFDPFVVPGAPATSGLSLMSDSDLIERIHAVRKGYARAVKGGDAKMTARIAKVLRPLQDHAGTRGLTVSGTDPLATETD
jgi:hypothetical protein